MRHKNKTLTSLVFIATLLTLGIVSPGCQQWLRIGFKAQAPVDTDSGAQKKNAVVGPIVRLKCVAFG